MKTTATRLPILLAVLLAACAPAPSATGGVLLTGIALAGPTCPVVTDPPDPACEDRPVEGAEIVLQDAAGNELARVTSDAEGRFVFTVPPGPYRLVPQSVEGLMGTAPPIDVVVGEGGVAEPVAVSYDTGIR